MQFSHLSPGITDQGEKAFMAEIIKLLKEHYRQPRLTTKEVARRAGVSESLLAHRFRLIAGKSVRQMLEWLRIEESQRLLSSNLTIKEIAARVGMPRPSQFCRAFKRATGLRPSAFRAQLSPGVGSSA